MIPSPDDENRNRDTPHGRGSGRASMTGQPHTRPPANMAVVKRFLLLGPFVGWAVVALGISGGTALLTNTSYGSPVGDFAGVLLLSTIGLPFAYLQGGIPAVLAGVVVSRWKERTPLGRYVVNAAGVGAGFAAAFLAVPAVVLAVARLLQGGHIDSFAIVQAAGGGAAIGGIAAGVCAWSLRRPARPTTPSRSHVRTKYQPSQRTQLAISFGLLAAAIGFVVSPAFVPSAGPRAEAMQISSRTHFDVNASIRRAVEMAERRAEADRARLNEALADPRSWKCRTATEEDLRIGTAPIRCSFDRSALGLR